MLLWPHSPHHCQSTYVLPISLAQVRHCPLLKHFIFWLHFLKRFLVAAVLLSILWKPLRLTENQVFWEEKRYNLNLCFKFLHTKLLCMTIFLGQNKEKTDSIKDLKTRLLSDPKMVKFTCHTYHHITSPRVVNKKYSFSRLPFTCSPALFIQSKSMPRKNVCFLKEGHLPSGKCNVHHLLIWWK